MNKKLLAMELSGAFFTAASSAFMRRLFVMTGGGLTGILFGSVNGSAWEQCKTLLLPFLVWAVTELMCLPLKIRRFTVAKTVALYFLGICCLLLRTSGINSTAADIIAVASALALSFVLYLSPVPLRWLFAPAVALLFLFWAVYFCFTPFPPRLAFFIDAQKGIYGLEAL